MIERARRELGFGGADDDRPRADVHLGDIALNHLGAEPLRLRAHLGHEIRPENAVAIARKVLHERGQHELTARLDAFDQERPQVGAGAVQRRRQTGGAGADDDEVSVIHEK